MKFTLSLSLLLLVMTLNTHAGGYYYGDLVNEYDRDSGLYYKSVKNGKEEGGFLTQSNSDNVSDINIFNTETEKSVLIFRDTKPRKIITFLYESKYIKDTKSISFGINKSSYNIKNNNHIENRPLKDRLLMVAYDEEKKIFEMWSCDKRGKNLKKIYSFKKKVNWHIDIKNSKIRFVHTEHGKIKIKSINW